MTNDLYSGSRKSNNDPVRATSSNSLGKTGADFLHSAVVALSPYSAIFCRSTPHAPTCNHQKINDFQESTDGTTQKQAANSLFWKILRISPSISVFCREYLRSNSVNMNGMNILREREKKICGHTTPLRSPKRERQPGEAAPYPSNFPFYARGNGPCWKWYCRIRAASAGLSVLPFGSMVRTTSPRHTTSVADRPAISAGSTRLISSCELGCNTSSAWNSNPDRLMFSVVPSCHIVSPRRR